MAPTARAGSQLRPPGWARSLPLAVVAGTTIWNLWSLRAWLRPVSYLYDAVVHEAMARFAAQALSGGHVPFSTWFPYMGMGSAQYLHYQSLASVLTGAVGTVVGAGAAFRWSTYLLVALWPLAVYGAGRIFGLPRGAAMLAAGLAPFVVSHTGIGFERGAYSWTGGAEVWTQLFGSWALAFAWAFAWRSFQDRRWLWAACALGGLTIDLHFMSGYLALLGVMVMTLSGSGAWATRLARGAVLLAGSIGSAMWVVVPLVLASGWSSINQALAGTPYVRGYGARQELTWLFTGQLFDARRAVPVVSVLVLAGAVATVARWSSAPLERTLLCLGAACLALSFGTTTWGALTDLVPAHADLYFRRFTMGTQLAWAYLAGTAVRWAWLAGARVLARTGARLGLRRAAATAFCFALVGWCVPAWSEIASYDGADAAVIRAQQAADATAGAQLAPLVAYVRAHATGRTYAGLSDNWGSHFMVGYVPVYKYLLTQDVDEMTYMVPTLSLMLGPEAEFDQYNPSDYRLFGISYLLLPSGMAPPVAATHLRTSGPYSLWVVPGSGYAEVVRTVGTIPEDRADMASQVQGLLQDLAPGEDWSVAYPGGPAPLPAQLRPPPGPGGAPGPGQVLRTAPDLAVGRFSATVDMARPGTFLLSVAYEPGWRVLVDGHRQAPAMLAPALVGVAVGPGRHNIELTFVGFGWYWELWLASAGVVAVVFAGAQGYGRRGTAPREGRGRPGPA